MLAHSSHVNFLILFSFTSSPIKLVSVIYLDQIIKTVWVSTSLLVKWGSLYMPFYVIWCCCSVSKSCLPLCDPMDCSAYYLPKFAHIYVHLSQWCYQTVSSSATHFFCLQPFPASRSFPVSQFFTSNGQNIGTLTSASVVPVNIQDLFPLGLIG